MVTPGNELKDLGRYVSARRKAAFAHGYDELRNRRRHVSHLTQTDLATLVGVSSVVISKVEQGRYRNLTPALLHRIASALHLTNQQSIYLMGLFEERSKVQRSWEPAPAWVEASVKLVAHPAVVVDPAYSVVSINDKALSLIGSMSPSFEPRRNGATSIFQLAAVREFIKDWHGYAASLVSGMRLSYAMYPEYRDYIDQIVLQLESIDPQFSDFWNQDDPLVKPTIEKQFNHPDLGVLNILQILTDIVESPGLTKVEFIAADDATRDKFQRM